MDSSGLRGIVESERGNAALGWVVVGVLLAVAVEELLADDPLWAGFVLATAALAVVPPVAYRDARVMLPWEVLALAALPALGRAFVAGERVAGVLLTGRASTYLAVAAVALIVAVEIDVFTPVKMNYSFAVLFVVVTTMAAAGLWAIAQYASDTLLGTDFLLGRGDEAAAEAALMWDFVAATGAGIGAGVVFELYFRRRAATRERLPGRIGTDGRPTDRATESAAERANDQADDAPLPRDDAVTEREEVGEAR